MPPWPAPTSCMRPGWREPAEPVRFDSVSGPLTARHEDGLLVLDFPARPAGPAPAPPGLLASARGGQRGVDGPGQGRPHGGPAPRGGGHRAAPRHRGAGRIRHPRRHRDRSGVPAGRGFRLPLLRPRRGDRRGPGDRLRALHPRPLLGPAAWPPRAHRLPGLGARRDGRGAGGGGPGAAGRPRRHRVLRPAERRRAPPAGRRSAADRVPLHAARVGRGVQEPAGPWRPR